MKSIYAIFASSIASILFLLLLLLFGGCSSSTPISTETPIPVIPTTLVYSIDAPDGFDRHAIAYGKPKSDRPETFLVEGKTMTLSIDNAITDFDRQNDSLFNLADIALADEIDPDKETYSAEVSILKAVTCRSIRNHDVFDETDTFQSSEKRVWCYTQVSMPSNHYGLIQHIWRYNGVEQHREDLFVQGANYRTYSNKTINPAQTGKWTIDIATENGDVLEVVEFELQ